MESKKVDPNSFSNYTDILIQRLHLDWNLDLDDKKIQATATYYLKVTSESVDQVHLDVYQLKTKEFSLDGQVLQTFVQVVNNQSLIQGDRLVIQLTRTFTGGEEFILKGTYEIDEKAKALSFLTKSQTGGQVKPYIFSQCEMNNCRSIIPIQDTPSVKFPYTSRVVSKAEINVFMSGEVTKTEILENGLKAKEFECRIPVPAYLIAIVAGAIEERQVGPRTYVVSEPVYMDDYVKELAILEDLLITVEDYIGPYVWGNYRIVILPPAFPFGGMENPLLTFASPSIMTGDGSGLGVVIHEIVHSWTGNLVTNANWSSFWLNEGFTRFLENKGVANSKYFGPEVASLQSYDGRTSMTNTIERFGVDHDYTSLSPNTEGKDPDESFSCIPYEKGKCFLEYLELLIGENEFKNMLREYVQTYAQKSVVTDQFKEFLLSWLTKTDDKLHIANQIVDIWDSWVKAPGHPPQLVPLPQLNRITEAQNLAKQYLDLCGSSPAGYEAFNTYLTEQKYIFLNYLVENTGTLTKETIKRIDDDLNLTSSTNKEILYRWFLACLHAKYYDNIESCRNFLGSIGRGKLIFPIYTLLANLDKERGIQYFNEHKDFYHPLARNVISGKLQVQL